ncbi:MAG: alpha/beta hydrolase [Lachnospiraceae bacterium]|nr:alpha/beta hydrolase [Lachnospiraceae bacterium]
MERMNISPNIKLKDLMKLPEFGNTGKYILFTPGFLGMMMGGMTLAKQEAAGWNHESIEYGLSRLKEVVQAGQALYPVYTEAECAKDKQKKDVNVIFFPKTEDHGKKPFLIFCAGGAYSSVCSAVEAYPVMARFNELGYDAFALTYRVGGKALLPKPIDDLAAALKMILAKSESFGVSDEYIVGGASAGANLISLFGTDNHGWKTYGLPKPKALIPVYTFINHTLSGSSPVMKFCLNCMFGKKPSQEKLAEYDIDTHMSQDYPPCYIVCGKDDSTVPPANSELLKKRLDQLSIPAVLEAGEHAEHGFGDGRGTSVEGWMDRADIFFASL